MNTTDQPWRGRSANRVPFGLREGRLHFVSDVETGLACGCVCPDPRCGQALIAKNRASPDRQRGYYFTHIGTAACCSGRESALHRMAKEIVLRASSILLPEWTGGGRRIPETLLALHGGAAAEVCLLHGQVRPDVQVSGDVDGIALDPLFVEIRVTHAVDAHKGDRVRSGRLSMIEIDLSDVEDAHVVDAPTFEQLVLHDASNRRWIHLDAPTYMAARLDDDVYDVRDTGTFRHDVPTRTGNTMHFTKQRATRYRPGEATINLDIEIADTYRADGQRVDGFGQMLPYAPGLYRRNWDARRTSPWDRSFDFKTFLTPLLTDSAAPQPSLF